MRRLLLSCHSPTRAGRPGRVKEQVAKPMITNGYYGVSRDRLEIAASSRCKGILVSVSAVRARYKVPAAMWLSGRDFDSFSIPRFDSFRCPGRCPCARVTAPARPRTIPVPRWRPGSGRRDRDSCSNRRSWPSMRPRWCSAGQRRSIEAGRAISVYLPLCGALWGGRARVHPRAAAAGYGADAQPPYPTLAFASGSAARPTSPA
jgi:hypothetical protein